MKGALIQVLVLACAAGASAQNSRSKPKDLDALFLDMSKANLGAISSEVDKQRYLDTIALEKARVTRKTLQIVYENAFDLYKRGDYEGTRELTSKILAIDPGFEDAAILQKASIELKGTSKPWSSERKLVEDRFEEGMVLYRQGRLVEAASRWEEATKLSPANLKARYWLRRVRGELAEEHFRRGQRAYRQHRLKETLDQWYATLVLNPRYPRLSALIAKVEADERDQEANEKLQAALDLYGQGQIPEALKTLDEVLQTGPGNTKAQKLMAEIRAEMASQHVSQGRQFYESRKYEAAISQWKQAVAYGYEPGAAGQLIARAKEQMRREESAKKRQAQMARTEAEKAKAEAEQAAKEDAEAKAKAEAEVKAATTPPAVSTAAAATGVPSAPTDEARRSSQQHYLSGVIFFQKSDYEKAKNEWVQAKQLDPGNSDAQAGLERIDRILGGGQ